MGWLDKLKYKISKKTEYAQMLNGYTPIFNQFGQDIYTSDVVRQAVSCIVREMKKLNPTHVRGEDKELTTVNSDIQKVLKEPNPIMTTSDFIEKIMWILFFNYNVFIVPVFIEWKEKGITKRKYKALYPVMPSQVDFIQDASDKLYIKMRFENNFETTLQYKDVIHVRYEFSINEFMGGDSTGQPDNRALLKTLQLNSDLLSGVSKGVRSSFAINGIVKYAGLIDKDDTIRNIKELEEHLKNDESGFLPLDLKAEYKPITKNIKLVDNDTLKFIDEKILRNFGVSIPILTGDYTTEQYNAFYQKTLEPLIISLSQAFTKALFTDKEKSHGNQIKFYPKELIFMSISQTLEMIRLLGDSGALYENEKRAALGLKPLPELEGVRVQSLNYVDVNLAKKYQTGK